MLSAYYTIKDLVLEYLTLVILDRLKLFTFSAINVYKNSHTNMSFLVLLVHTCSLSFVVCSFYLLFYPLKVPGGQADIQCTVATLASLL